MKPLLLRIAHGLDRIGYAALWISGLCLVLMTVVIAYQVFGRYVLNNTPPWAEALSVTFMGWFIFLGAAVGVNERTHLGFDVLLASVPASVRRALRTISDVAVLAFGLGMIFFGMDLTIKTWDAVRPTLGIPDGARYIPLVLGGVLVSLFTLKILALRLAGEEVDDATVEVDRG